MVRARRRGIRGAGIAGALAMLGLASGCGESPSGPAPSQLERLPRQLTAAEEQLISASNRFAFGLLREADATGEGGNVFLSPLSASLALGMTMNGAAGTTYSEMRQALGFGEMEEAGINASYRSLIELLLELDPTVDTRVANSIWYRETFPFEQTFFDVARESFFAEVAGLPFAPSDRTVINDWVREATGGKIPEIVDEIRDEHVMFLINAIYFKGSWTEQFERSRTRPEPFHVEGGGSVTVPMMRREGEISMAGAVDYQAVDLPYGNGAFSMTLVVPTGEGSVDDLVASLDAERWAGLVASLRETRGGVAMPRFRLEYRQVLNDALQALGMRRAFLPTAEFARMSGEGGLMISQVLQKTYVDVNEEGTEAAAATSVGVVVTSLPPEVRIDRPFVVAIRERFSGTILFLGKVVDPS